MRSVLSRLEGLMQKKINQVVKRNPAVAIDPGFHFLCAPKRLHMIFYPCTLILMYWNCS